MKFFSSFDTTLKKKYIQDFSDRYWKDNIVVISRSNLYFLKKVAIHIFFGVISYIIFLVGIYILIWQEYTIKYWIILWLLFPITFFIIAAENHIDYAMNYAIFTPHEAILVEQLWFFKRTIKSLDTKKIKSISIRKSNRIYSLFDDGLLTIFNEGSSTHGMGEIIFKYVNQPEKVKNQIQRIMTLHEPKDII